MAVGAGLAFGSVGGGARVERREAKEGGGLVFLFMTNEPESQYERAKSLFLAAAELGVGAAREGFLDDACGDDGALRSAVERMLAIDDADSDDGDVGGGGSGSAPLIPATIEEGALQAALAKFGSRLGDEETFTDTRIPERIGDYEIEGILGEGGMGLVYRARQAEPDRAVALKVIRTGYPTHKLVRRFRHEAAVLGRLRHPGIAQIYEAGTAETAMGAEPFFAMELVEGKPLIAYADEGGLDVRGRLSLFCEVCEAVQHAHQKGVIHRDLKPANILVEVGGQPKVLDFGVARLADPDMQTTTMHTEMGQLMGTFQYMSPEQARGNPTEVDTRSDVYALGMVLYELLAGRVAYDLAACSIPEALRMIEETTADALSVVDRSLGGDLETIMNKALAKEKDARYQSAHALAEDLGRYLRHETVLARPASTWYQVRKFTERNKGLVVGSVFAVTILIVISIAMTMLAIYAMNQTDLVESESARVTRLSSSISSVIDSLSPENALAAEKRSTDELLGELIRQVDNDLEAYPIPAASIRHRVGKIYRQLGWYAESEVHLAAAFDARRELLGMGDAQARESEYELGHALFRLHRLDEAEEHLLSALDYSRAHEGPEAARTLEITNDLGALAMARGNLSVAEELLVPVRAKLLATLGADAWLTLQLSNNVGHLRFRQGRYDEADVILRDTLRRRRAIGSERYNKLESMDNLAQNCVRLRLYEEARELAAGALAIRRLVEGDDHPFTLLSMAQLIRMLRLVFEFEAADELTAEFLEARLVFLKKEPSLAMIEYNNVAAVFRAQRKHAEAVAILRDVYAAGLSELGADAERTLAAGLNLGVVLVQMEAFEEAEVFLSAGIGRTVNDDVLGRFYRAVYSIYLGRCLMEREAFVEAEAALKIGYEGMVEWEDAAHPQAVIARNLLEEVYRATDQEDKIAEYFN